MSAHSSGAGLLRKSPPAIFQVTAVATRTAYIKAPAPFSPENPTPFDGAKYVGETALSAEQKGVFRSFIDGQDEATQRAFLLKNANKKEMNKYAIQQAMRTLQRTPTDTGSTDVQIAALSTRIVYLTNHIVKHPKDFHNRRILMALVQQRRKLLKYLKRTDFGHYLQVLQKLDIRGVETM